LPDPDAKYKETITLNAGMLEPLVACPHNVDNIRQASELKKIKVDSGYLGSCTNGRLEDLEVAAEILNGKKIKSALVVYPASKKIMKLAEGRGILETLRKAGAEIMTSTCGPCFGTIGSTLKDGEVRISSSNRNFQAGWAQKKHPSILQARNCCSIMP